MILKPFTFWFKIAFLFLYRSVRSTAILSLMILSAVSTLIFLSAMAIGINDAMIRNSVSLFSGHISGFYLPEELGKERLFVKGVKNVLQRSLIPGILSHGKLIETVSIFAVDPYEEMKSTAIWKKTIKGRYLEKGEREVFMSQRISERLNVQPGESVQFTSIPSGNRNSFIVSGIYKTGIEQLDQGIAFCPQDVMPLKGKSWSAAVFLEEGVHPDSVISIYQDRFPQMNQFKSWVDLMPDLKQLIDLNYVSMSIVIILVFGVVSLGISCAFVIFILKNIREYGIMKAMGVTPQETTLLIVAEVILMNLAASMIGVFIGTLSVLFFNKIGIDLTALTPHNRYFAVSGVIFPRLTSYSLFLPPVIAFLFSLVSAIWPAILLARKKAADVIRMV